MKLKDCIKESKTLMLSLRSLIMNIKRELKNNMANMYIRDTLMIAIPIKIIIEIIAMIFIIVYLPLVD